MNYYQSLTTFLLAIGFFVSACNCIDPPLMATSFQIAFDETFEAGGKKYTVNGQMFYDAKNNHERVDRTDGRYDLFCGSILPNVTTPCTQLTTQNKRYIIFPNKRQCCFCCDSAHGCGILRQDWLNDAEYLGKQKLIDSEYDKWSKDGMFGYNIFHVTTDDTHIPRRLNQSGTHITDYIVQSFTNKTFGPTTFAVPSYCTDSCPLTTICGSFRQTKLEELNLKKQ